VRVALATPPPLPLAVILALAVLADALAMRGKGERRLGGTPASRDVFAKAIALALVSAPVLHGSQLRLAFVAARR
jgi:hypothetical protein